MAPKKNSKAAIEETASKPSIRSVSTAGSNAALGGNEGTDAPTKGAIPAVVEKPKEPVDPLAYKVLEAHILFPCPISTNSNNEVNIFHIGQSEDPRLWGQSHQRTCNIIVSV
jgi:hypothetical protein